MEINWKSCYLTLGLGSSQIFTAVSWRGGGGFPKKPGEPASWPTWLGSFTLSTIEFVYALLFWITDTLSLALSGTDDTTSKHIFSVKKVKTNRDTEEYRELNKELVYLSASKRGYEVKKNPVQEAEGWDLPH